VKIDITGTKGEVSYVGVKDVGHGEMDEIVVGFTLEGSAKGMPVALCFEDTSDTALFTIDLTADQAEKFAKALFDTAAFARERARKRT